MVGAVSVTVTGATGLIGEALVAALRDRGAHVTILSRNPERARDRLDAQGGPPVLAICWDPLAGPAPSQALAGRDAVVHLAGESIAQRWTAKAKRAIRDSRVHGTRNLIAGLESAQPRPRTLVSASGTGYYGAHGEEPLDEESPPGGDFLADVCMAWEAEARRALALDMRVVLLRSGVVLSARGGALGKMLTPFRLGLGGAVAGGRQYMSWIHRDDEVGLIMAVIDDERWSGPLNATAPEPVSNRDFARALGQALSRPARLPVPAFALHALYGEMAQTITNGARVMPAKALVLGYRFRHPHLEQALRSALARG